MKRIIVLAVFALAACEPVVGSRYVKSQEMTASAGGELTIDASENAELAGTRLSIPANALPSNTQVTVEIGLDALVTQTRIASPVVVFGPQSLQLNGDATVVLPLSRVKPGEIITISARAGDGSPYDISSSNISLDADNTHATFSVRRFGSFQAQRSNACVTNTDCASGEQCVNGLCDAVCVAQTETCNGVDDDCDGIVDNGCSVSCNSDTDCASGQWCVRGTCETDPSTFDGGSWSCTSNNDCLSGEDCINGSCVPSCVAQTETCNGIDDDCDGIVDNGCNNPIDGGSFCRTNLECNPSQQCVNGSCQSGNPINDGGVAACNTDTDCASGELCLNNACELDPRADGGFEECLVDTDCASGQVCSSGVCVIDADGGAFECATANDCASGEDCINGSCEAAALDGGSAPFCRTDLECDPIHPTCVNNVCQ